MYQPSPYPPHQGRAFTAQQHYRQDQILSADPMQLLIMTYDFVIAGCRERNLEKVSRGLQELMDHLDHEAGGQVAADLLSLYHYLADLARHSQYDDAVAILRDLRNTWAQAREQLIRQQAAPVMSIAA